MELRILGTRGSCAAPFADRSEFGGNTSSISLRSGNCWLILDAGTGIIPLAAEIRRAADSGVDCRVRIVLSHFHLDHIIGLPMFLAALPKSVQVTVYTASDSKSEVPRAAELDALIGPPLWPVKLTYLCPGLCFEDIDAAVQNDIGNGITIKAIASNHPNNTYIYRINWEDRDIVYGLDCELTDEFTPVYTEFSKGCDILLFDGAYTDEDYKRCSGFGHSAFTKALDVADKTGCGKLLVMHYDYAYTDEMLSKTADEFAQKNERIVFAKEGRVFEI